MLDLMLRVFVEVWAGRWFKLAHMLCGKQFNHGVSVSMFNKIGFVDSTREQHVSIGSSTSGDAAVKKSFELFEHKMAELEAKTNTQANNVSAMMKEYLVEGTPEAMRLHDEVFLEVKRLGSNITRMNQITLKAHKMNEYLCDVVKNAKI